MPDHILYAAGNQPSRRPAHIPRSTGQKPSQLPTHHANDQARNDEPLQRLGHQTNPLTFMIQQAREVLIWGCLPNWLVLGSYTLVATAIAWAGYAWFQKTRKGFADVL